MNPQDTLDASKPMKRKRLTQACDVCRKKKVKCDGNRPSCSNCIRLNVSCSYLPSCKKRGPRQGLPASEEKFMGGSAEFFRRLSAPGSAHSNDLEQKNPSLRSSSLPNTNTSSNMISVPVLSTSPFNHFSNFSHIPIPSFDAGGTPFFGNIGSQVLPASLQNYSNSKSKEKEKKSVVEDVAAVREKVEQVWSQSYLGNTSGLHSLSTGGSKEKTPSPKGESEVLCLVGADSLPPPQITEHLANLYFDIIYPQMPFVHRPTFFRKLKNKEVPPILILSICACVSRLSNHPAILADDSTRRGEIFSDRFRDILVLCLDDPCLSTVQALLIFSYYEYTNARISRSWMYLGMAVRMAQELGINRIDEGGSAADQCPSEWVEAETRRRVWWSCFIRDRLVSSGTGRSMAIDEQDTRVLLPCDDKDYNNENPVETELLDISDNVPVTSASQTCKKENCIGYRAHWVKLVALLGRVSQFVNSPKFRRTRSSVETSARFTTLENSLGVWAESLPAQYKYPCKLVNESSPSGYSRAGFIICIHILYHTIIILLHRSKLDVSTTESVVVNSWKKCIVSANEIVTTIPEFSSYPSCYNYPHISFGIFTAGTVFMHSLFSSHVTSVAEEARRKLEHAYRTLLMLQKEWPMAGKYGVLLKGLMSIRNRVITQKEEIVSDRAAGTCKLEDSLSPVTLQPPTSGLKFNQLSYSAPEAKPEQLDVAIEPHLTHEPSQTGEGTAEFFYGFHDFAEMPFGQGLFFDGLLNNIYMNSCTDSSTKSSPLPFDTGDLSSGFIPEQFTTNTQTFPADTQGLIEGWSDNLAYML